MNRTDRLIGIVLLLHSRKIVRAKDIARHFGITLRTVYRDMKALNEAGVPIAAESGEGYSLVEGYHLPPVMFTQEEASALYMGGELTRSFTDRSLHPHIESALTKVLAVLPSEKKEYLEKLRTSTAIHTPAVRFKKGFRDDVITVIQEAVVHRRVLSLEYFSNRRDELTKRKIEPLGVVYYSNYWHLIGYCRLRKDYRDFRTDRIKSIELQDENFTERKDFSLEDYLKQDRETENLQEVRIKFKHPVASYITERYYYGLINQEPVEDGVIMTFMVPSADLLTGWLLSYGENVAVLTPPILKELLFHAAQKLVQQYTPARSRPSN